MSSAAEALCVAARTNAVSWIRTHGPAAPPVGGGLTVALLSNAFLTLALLPLTLLVLAVPLLHPPLAPALALALAPALALCELWL